MQKHGEKPHEVGSVSGGSKGGGISAGKRVQTRSAMMYLTRLLGQIEEQTKDDLRDGLEFARSVRSNPESSDRDRLRANEYIQAVMNMGVGVAGKLSDTERLDNGDATQRIEVVFTNQLPTRAED